MPKIKAIAIFAVCIVLIVAVPAAGCGKIQEDTQFVDNAVENILVSMNEDDYASFSRDLDDTVKTELPEAAFPDFVSAVYGSNGNYGAGSKKLNSVSVKEDIITVEYTADFEIFEDVTVEVTFRDMGNEKKVIKLWFLGPATNLFIGNPGQ